MPMTLRSRRLPSGFWAGSSGRSAPKRKRGGMRKPRVSKALTQAVKSIVKRTEEKKYVSRVIENAVQHNGFITTSDEYPILPIPNAGGATTSDTRFGNKITPTSLTLSGVVSYNDYGQNFNEPIHVVVYVLQSKSVRYSADLPTNDINFLMEDGSPTGASWNASTAQSLCPLNKELFQVLGTRTFKLGQATAENPNCQSRRYSIKVKTPKTLDYNGAGVQYPSNFAPFVVLGWCREDGVIPGVADLYVKHTCVSKMYYTDA